jgi:uncharacterized protein (TIGR03067 family)
MRTRLAGLVLLGMTLVSASVAVGGDAKADLKKFAGTWAVESARERGKDVPEEKIKKVTVTFAGDKFTLSFEGKRDDEGTFTIDPGKKPRHIDLNAKGKSIPGVYAFEGGRLKICFSEGGERPPGFDTAKGSKNVLLVLKRAKK